MWWTLLFSHKDFYCLCFQRYSQVSPLRARFPWRCKWSQSVQWLEACPAVISLAQQEKTVHLPFTIAFPSVQRVGRYFPIKLQDTSLCCAGVQSQTCDLNNVSKLRLSSFASICLGSQKKQNKTLCVLPCEKTLSDFTALPSLGMPSFRPLPYWEECLALQVSDYPCSLPYG